MNDMNVKQTRTRIDCILFGTVLLSLFLNIYGIWKETNANAYYTAAVSSMLQNWHAFFYGSLDPVGFVTVDKPPVVFWIQTLSAAIFGVHGWSVILPQALGNVGSVLLMYFLVRPAFGRMAARLAALAMALTPVAVAVSRTNNIDGMLVFALVLAAWMLLKGVRQQKAGWVLGAFALVGVGFNMKMLEAYMVLPAFYLFYWIAFRTNWKKRLGVLSAATAVLIVVSFSWATIVELIPQEKRPYIGSSQTNSVFELAFGYNGLSRLTGDRNRGGAGGERPDAQQQLRDRAAQDGGVTGSTQGNSGQGIAGQATGPQRDGRGQGQFQRGGQGGVPAGGGQGQPPSFGDPGGGAPWGPGGRGGMFNTGSPGVFRLFQTQLSGQASWLLPFALFSCIGLLAGIRRRKAWTDREKETLFWLGWLVPVAGFFSIAGFFHQYYLIMLAPPIAAITGAGWTALWRSYRERDGWSSWLLPTGLLVTAAFECYILRPYQAQIGSVLTIGIGSVGLILTVFLLAMRLNVSFFVYRTALSAMLVLMIAPLYWSFTPILAGAQFNSMMPAAGPVGGGMGGGPGGNRPAGSGGDVHGESVNAKLVQYVTEHSTGEPYLFATTNAGTAEAYIIQTRKAVMAMGGFSGSDPILTVEKLQKLVVDKQVKFFLISSGSGGGFRGFGGPGGGASSEVQTWIREHAQEVPAEDWGGTTGSTGDGGFGGFGGGLALYEIQS